MVYGNFYTIESNIDGKIDAKCVECGEIREGYIASTGNFISHYRKHPSLKKQLDKYLKQCTPTADDGVKLLQPSIRDSLPSVSEDEVFIFIKLIKMTIFIKWRRC